MENKVVCRSRAKVPLGSNRHEKDRHGNLV